MIKVVGIDPGLAGTGIGVVEGTRAEIVHYSFGSIHTHPQEPVSKRLHTIYSKTIDFLTAQKPDRVIIEDIYSLEKYPRSGILLGKVSGALILAVHAVGIEPEEIAVREAKKIVSGNGGADKYQMERAVRNLLGHHDRIRPFHASDALGLALTGYFRYNRTL